jgi:ribosomal protein S18 acetylase RimI-like enzyme
MKTQLQTSHGLTEKQLSQIAQLAKRCDEFENLHMKLNWSHLRHRPFDEVNDFLYYVNGQLVGYLALYGFGRREVEISAMVNPAYRQLGIFKALLSASRQEVEKRGVPDLLFICERKSSSGQAAIHAIGAKYQFTEYEMSLARPVRTGGRTVAGLGILPATAADIPLLAQMDELCFQIPIENAYSRLYEEITGDHPRQARVVTMAGEIIGKIHVVTTETEVYLAGFCVLPKFRGRGLGSAVLAQIVDELVSAGHRQISLEVETKNKGALKIYERSGFEITTAYDYFRLPTVSPKERMKLWDRPDGLEF